MWEKQNIPRHALSYTLTPNISFYITFGSTNAQRWGEGRPHMDSKAQTGETSP